MANKFVNVRCPQKVIDLLDSVCELYGFTRSELMRTGAINYCNQLLATDSLLKINETCHEVADKASKEGKEIDLEALKDIDMLVDVISKQYQNPIK
jgi:antitoxin component of RelBE/YafQ-DinJ toxin-antitoxin module